MTYLPLTHHECTRLPGTDSANTTSYAMRADRLDALFARGDAGYGYGYGFVAVDLETGTVVSGYVADGVLVTDPDRMDPESAHSLLESDGTSDSDDQTP